MSQPSVLIVDSNPARAQKTSRVTRALGVQARTATPDNAALPEGCAMVIGPLDAGDALVRMVGNSGVPLYLWRDEKMGEELDYIAANPTVNGLFGLRHPGATPRPWELVALLGRHLGRTPAPPHSPLTWGCTWQSFELTRTEQRDKVTARVEQFATPLAGGRVAARLTEVAHELIMNAMYDAPADANGNPLYAHDRRAQVHLAPEHRVAFGFGSDGVRMVMAVQDVFGRLPRQAFFGGLARGARGGEMDTSGGGAGLGFTVIADAVGLVFVDVVPQRLTQMITVAELDVPVRELRSMPRSLHFVTY